MTGHPLVSVIVPHYQDLERLDLCLSDLGKQTFPADQFEVIVSDNASPVGEAAVAKVIAGRAKLVITTEKGAGPTRNGAVAVARGEIFAFTDSDCRPEPDWLSEGVAALKSCDIVGGRMKVHVADSNNVTGVEAFERVFAFNNKRYVNEQGFSVTANLFCSRATFEKVGDFQNGVSEDVEWCHRARAAGYKIGYAEKCVIGHPARRDWAELITKWKRSNKEQLLLFQTRPGGRFKWLLRNCALPLSAVVHTPRVLLSKELSGFKERRDALGVLYRIRFWRLADGVRLIMKVDSRSC